MKLAEVKHIKVGEKSFPVKLTQRAMIDYENLTGETIVSFKGSERLCKLFYCTAKAGARAEKRDFDYTFDQFLDVIDDYYLDVLNNFSGVIFSEFTPAEGEAEKKK